MSALLLTGGTVIDGTGRAPFTADVFIHSGRVAALDGREAPADAERVDCRGCVVAPGFIDAHSHSDLQVLENRPEKTLQGVTTEVVGNCGFSAYPAAQDRHALHDFANGIFCGGDDWGWDTAAAYLHAAESRGKLVSVASLVGHGTLRIAIAGTRLGGLTAGEVDAMEQKLDESLAAGACGFSTGLMYSPGESAPFDELERLCRVVARRGKIYCTHMRDYGFRLLESLDEQIELARRTDCRLQISHFQAVGTDNWSRQGPALEKIERARAEGVDIAFDCYPYVAGSTVLTQLLPQRALEGGTAGLMALLAMPDQRKRIAEETIAGMAHRWTDIYVSAVASEENQPLVGMNIQEIAEARGCEPIDAVLDLLVEERGAVNQLEFNQSEENLRQTLTHSLSNVISDGFYVKGKPHPRLHGTFPELLGRVCREKRWMDLPTAIHKITGRPAERFALSDRGRLEPGCRADVVVFDAEKVGSAATYENPEVSPMGIRWVVHEGQIVAAQGSIV
ncbi:MAG TPA: D-aminoacylase [Bryobacteraceae bacterium]|nr:D-aminoacylase [Bryobacteraceae bacterium]